MALELLAVLYPAQRHVTPHWAARLDCIVSRRRRHGTGWHNSLLQILCMSECFSSIICAYMLIILQIWLSNPGIWSITVSANALLWVLFTSKCSSSHTCAYIWSNLQFWHCLERLMSSPMPRPMAAQIIGRNRRNDVIFSGRLWIVRYVHALWLSRY